jgi:hypothetical protein
MLYVTKNFVTTKKNSGGKQNNTIVVQQTLINGKLFLIKISRFDTKNPYGIKRGFYVIV